jgi:RNAse (barnase) inhibitor barstar
MKNKFNNILFSYIEENITIDQKRLARDLERVSQSLPDQTKKALEATSQAMVGATETDPIEAEFQELAKKENSDEQKVKILMSLISKKALPDITQKMQQNKEEETEEKTEDQKPKQSSLTYSAPSFQ